MASGSGPVADQYRGPLDGITVKIVEVGPRDGLQNEPGVVSTDVKAELIHRLFAAGVRALEAASFVRPDRIPQMADGDELVVRLRPPAGARVIVLAPNTAGLQRALDAGVREVAVFAAASEAFSQRNVGRSIADSVAMFRGVAERALGEGLDVRAYVSTILGCPYQGSVPVDDVRRVVAAVHALGCHEISLGDTIGVGTAGEVYDLIQRLADVPSGALAAHMHDTYGQGLANSLAAIAAGVRVVDASVGGLGGCPFAGPGARGNLATEDLVYALHRSGASTGIDLDALVTTSTWLHQQLGRAVSSRAGAALAARESSGTASAGTTWRP